jgi:hypothetical protein
MPRRRLTLTPREAADVRRQGLTDPQDVDAYVRAVRAYVRRPYELADHFMPDWRLLDKVVLRQMAGAFTAHADGVQEPT